MIYRLIIFIIFSVLLSGCATVNRGATDYFRIDTVPQGAKATTSIETYASKTARAKNIDTSPIYKSCEPTPCAIALPRRSEFIITLEQDGYETAEMYITNSSNSGSFTANMAATTATAAGATVATAGTIAAGSAIATGIATATSAVIGGISGASVSLATFGLIPAEAAISTGISLATSSVPAATTTSSALSATIPPALIVTGGMLLTDVATGANVNLYPNPVVLKMAPKGTPIKIDPNVEPFKNILNLRNERDDYCSTEFRNQELHIKNKEKCQNSRTAYSKAIANKKAAEKAAKERYRAEKRAAKTQSP